MTTAQWKELLGDPPVGAHNTVGSKQNDYILTLEPIPAG